MGFLNKNTNKGNSIPSFLFNDKNQLNQLEPKKLSILDRTDNLESRFSTPSKKKKKKKLHAHF